MLQGEDPLRRSAVPHVLTIAEHSSLVPVLEFRLGLKSPTIGRTTSACFALVFMSHGF